MPARNDATSSPSTGSARQTGTQTAEKQRIPYLFTASVTASYARKFSIETKVHSEIKVTMKSYPAPETFLQAVLDHYKNVK